MATTKVNSEFIAVNAISGTIIADGAITSTHLAANCVDSSELVTGSIDTIHIAANQVTATKIVTNGVLTRHISDDQVTADKLANSINTDIATGPAALPKAGGTMTGTLNITQASTADTIKLTRSTTAQNNMIKFASDSADKWIVGQRNDSTEHFRFYSYGTSSDVLSILTDGNVGIGTTSPSQKLHIAGAGNQFILINNTSTNDGFFFKAGAGASSIQTNAGSHLMNFFTGGNERLRIDSAGQIGIGGGNYGTDGQVLTSTGASSAPAWEDAAGGPTSKEGGTNFTNSIMIGDDSTGTLSSAERNTGVGKDIFASLTSGTGNHAFGYQALDALTTGANNVAIGETALGALVDGNYNVAIGHECLAACTSSYNVAIGYKVLDAQTSGANNVGIGYRALSATNGSWSVAIGTDALRTEATSGSNVAIGGLAMQTSNGASNCTAVGKQAGYLMTTGDYNTFIGSNCGFNTTSSTQNTAVGYTALYSNETGNRNTALGQRAGYGYTGSENVFIGNESGEGSSSGNFNTFVGHQAGEATNGSSNIILGNATSIGSVSNRYVIGNSNNGTGTQDYAVAFVRGNSDWSRILIGGTSISASSDERKKKDITNHTLGLSFVNRLRPVNFKWKAPSDFPDTFTDYDSEITTPSRTHWQTGLIAQEVKAAMDAEGIETEKFDGWNEEEDGSQALSPAQLIMPLIKAIQEQQTIIDDLKARIDTLEG